MTLPDHHPRPGKPSWRKPVGMLAIMLIILLWCGIVVTLTDSISKVSIWVQLVIYLVAGIGWIFPVKPMLQWMNSGKFRHDPAIKAKENGASDET